MKRERVYFVEWQDDHGRWHRVHGGHGHEERNRAKDEARDESDIWDRRYPTRVMPYDRVPNARPLLVVKGSSNAD